MTQDQPEIVRHLDDGYSVEIGRGQNGARGWAVTVRGADDEKTLALLKKIVRDMKASIITEMWADR